MERQVLLDAVFVGGMDDFGTPQIAAAFGPLGLAQVPATGLFAENPSASRDFEPLDHRLFGFDAFGTSHKSDFCRKRVRNIAAPLGPARGIFASFGPLKMSNR